MKTYTKSNITSEEINNTIDAEKIGVGPHVISTTHNSITLELYDMTYSEYINKFPDNIDTLNYAVTSLVEILHKNSLIHCDLHEDNIIVKCDTTGNMSDVKIIDFYALFKFGDPRINEWFEHDQSLEEIMKINFTEWKHSKLSIK